MKNKRFRQGQTKWMVAVYKPGSVEGYDGCYVAAVHRCFITKVDNGTIFYDIDGKDHRLCRIKYWNKELHSTFRKAFRNAENEIKAINNKLNQ